MEKQASRRAHNAKFAGSSPATATLMTIRNFKTKNYHGCPIYVRYFLNVDDTWEYLTVINGQVYSAQIIIKRKFLQKFFRLYYSRKEEEGAINYLTSMAMATIEQVKKVKPAKLQSQKPQKEITQTPKQF